MPSLALETDTTLPTTARIRLTVYATGQAGHTENGSTTTSRPSPSSRSRKMPSRPPLGIRPSRPRPDLVNERLGLGEGVDLSPPTS